MTLLSVTDMIISCTLALNALALASNRLSSMLPTAVTDDSSPSQGNAVDSGDFNSRLRTLLIGIRKYSCVIAMWNILFMFLMMFVFD